jgi:putative ABC transport system ATP-binding protein
MDLFSELNSTHHTSFIIATHDQRVMAHIPRLIRMLDGRIVEDIQQHAS